jgi:hypothetical protein
MRTTLTIDPANAARLKRLLKERDLSLKSVVNDALRHGLNALAARPNKRASFRIPILDCGKPAFNSPEELKELLAEIQLDEDMHKLGMK